MSATAAPIAGSRAEFLGHPKGLYICFSTEMWERFAFYGMKAILFLYLTKHHLFAQGDGYVLLGTYAGLAYALPLIGGMLADRYLGMRKAVVLGAVLLVFGQLGMAYIGTPASGSETAAVRDEFAIQVMYFSLALIAVGVGFLKPNISTIVGRLYPDNDPRRDSGFTVFYMGINLGAALSSLIVGYVGEEIGWGYGFGLAGLLMAVGLVNFLLGQKYFHGHAEPARPELLRERVAGLPRETLIYLGALLATVAVWQILQMKFDFGPLSTLLGGHEVTATEIVAVALGAGLIGWFFWFVFGDCTREQRHQMSVLMVLIAISALFWGLYEQTYGTWVAISDIGMNRGMLGVEPTAGQLTSVGAIFVILLSPIFAWLWPRLDRHGLNPSSPAKFGLGLVFAGLAFGVLVLGIANPDANGKISVWWLIAAYFVLELGEMVLSPIGLSAVTSLSVPRVVGMMMGAWFLFSAFGEIIAGRFGTLAAMPADTPLPTALGIYGGTFEFLMWVGLGAGALMLVFTPLLNRGMHGVR
jgi:POT family proton-dependent oligopeptide transporter